jgi:hypothetical protein
MARKKSKRTYGSGSIVELKGGLGIRWREPVIGAGGEITERRCYQNIGAVSWMESGHRLQDKMQAARRAGPRLVDQIPTFREHAARYTRDILQMLDTERDTQSAIHSF